MSGVGGPWRVIYLDNTGIPGCGAPNSKRSPIKQGPAKRPSAYLRMACAMVLWIAGRQHGPLPPRNRPGSGG